MSRCRPAVLALLLLLPGLMRGDEEKTLKDGGVDTSDQGLLQFFRTRTPNETTRQQIEDLVRQLGADQFDTRRKASEELVRRGLPAVPFLRRALEHSDLEVRRRAGRALETLTNSGEPTRTSAAIALLARRGAANDKLDVVPVLLAWLPHAGEASLEQDAIDGLLTASPAGRAIDKALLAALDGPLPVVREAAVYVVGQRGNPAQRELVRKRLADRDPRVRLRAAEALLIARDKEAVEPLVELLAHETLAWRAEELLIALAGDKAPKVSAGNPDEGARRKCLDAWRAWWKANRETADLARITKVERFLGFTLGVEYNTGCVWECGMDGKLRWQIRDLRGPMEAQVLPGGRVLVVESNANTISERDLTGKVLWSKALPISPNGCQRLPNGNTFVSSTNEALEYDAGGTQVYRIRLPGHSNAVWKARNGRILTGSGKQIVELDTTGKELRRIPLTTAGDAIGVQDLPGDRFLVADRQKAVEVDSAGKVHWQASLVGACGVCRLLNGHTLVSCANLVVEFDREGKKVWEVKSEGYVRRVHRR
jgi:HEAT repeat protein